MAPKSGGKGRKAGKNPWERSYWADPWQGAQWYPEQSRQGKGFTPFAHPAFAAYPSNYPWPHHPVQNWPVKAAKGSWPVKAATTPLKAPKKEAPTSSGEFWYASTSKSFDDAVTTTGIDSSRGKYKGYVFYQRTLEAAEATADRFGIERVHKIDVKAMQASYGAKGTILFDENKLDISWLPDEDRCFVRPRFIETRSVRPPGSRRSSHSVPPSPEIVFNPLAVATVDSSSEDEDLEPRPSNVLPNILPESNSPSPLVQDVKQKELEPSGADGVLTEEAPAPTLSRSLLLAARPSRDAQEPKLVKVEAKPVKEDAEDPKTPEKGPAPPPPWRQNRDGASCVPTSASAFSAQKTKKKKEGEEDRQRREGAKRGKGGQKKDGLKSQEVEVAESSAEKVSG